jgi:soluble lytic murein transglycosylase-like protein
LGVRNLYDVEQNVVGGTAYLRQQLERFGNNVPLALAAYNAGPGAVIKYGGIPPYRETQNYVRQIMQRLSTTSTYHAGY